MASSVRLEINAAKILGRVKRKWMENLPAITTVIRADTNEYVKFDQGQLKQSSYTASQPSRGLIIWNTPYARKQYYEGRPRKVRNPKATILWCEEAKRRHLKEWRNYVAERVTKR